MNKKIFWVLIVLAALFVRTYDLQNLPYGLHFSESTIGWRAQNILNYAKDEFGRILPLTFSNWQRVELPIPTYIATPFVFIDKTNPFFLRLPFALLGTLSVIAAMLLAKKLFPDKKHINLYTGFILALSPGLIGVSRTTSPELVFFTLTLWGLLLIENKGKLGHLGAALLFLSFFTSEIAFFILPGLLLMLSFLGVARRNILIAAAGFPISLLLLLSSPGGLESLITNNFSILRDRGILDDVNKVRGEELKHGSPFFAKIFFNKLFYLIKAIENFLSHLNPSYIFARGDTNPLNGNSNFGPMLFTTLPMFIIGLFRIPKNRHFARLCLIFLLSCAASLFMLSGPHTNRFLLALFPLSLVAAYGIASIQKKFVVPALFIILLNFSIVAYDAIAKENERSRKTWNKDTYELATKLKDGYTDKKIWITDKIDPNPGPTIAYLTETGYMDTNLGQEKHFPRAWVNKIKNISIGNIKGNSQSSQDLDLILISKEDIAEVKDEKIFSCRWDEVEKSIFSNNYLMCSGN